MPLLCEMEGVRGGDTGFPVQLYRDEETGRLVIRGINEGGFACVDIDLRDLARWFGLDPDAIEFAVTTRKHRHRHEEGL